MGTTIDVNGAGINCGMDFFSFTRKLKVYVRLSFRMSEVRALIRKIYYTGRQPISARAILRRIPDHKLGHLIMFNVCGKKRFLFII